MERAAMLMPMPMTMPRLLRPPPSIYAAPSPSPRRLPPFRRATMRTRSEHSTTKTATTVKLTYLEFNGWLWELDGGMPWLFDGAKKMLLKDGIQEDLAVVDLLLITSSLDDHCHLDQIGTAQTQQRVDTVRGSGPVRSLIEPPF
nr:uncharacterized protein LOC109745249 [Aegilops tauschii subsp. strangulata]